MTVEAPTRSLEQRREALKKANEIRSYRAVVKDDLKKGRQQAKPILMDPAPEMETLKVYDLLIAVPKFGRVKVNKTLMQCRISPSKTLGGLSGRQRRELAEYL